MSISGDDIAAFKSFWSSLNIQLAAANRYNAMYLPNFHELSSDKPLRTQIYPPTSYSDSHQVKAHLDYIATLIYNVLGRDELTLKAPKAHLHINNVIHDNQDG